MTKRVEIQTEMTAEELHKRYREAKEAVERSHWHMLWLLKEGKTPQEIAALLGYTARWVREIVRRWNTTGPAGISDHRQMIKGAQPLLSSEWQGELAIRLQEPPEDGGLWSGPKVANWMEARLGRPVASQRGWEYLRRLGYSPRVPRRQHGKADAASQQAFKKLAGRGSPHSAAVSPSSGGAVGHG